VRIGRLAPFQNLKEVFGIARSIDERTTIFFKRVEIS
jgi:hypothetical protein